MTGDQQRIEDRLAKGAESGLAQAAAPEPVGLVFTGSRFDFPQSVDPVSGQLLMSMVVTAGNDAMRLLVTNLDAEARFTIACRLLWGLERDGLAAGVADMLEGFDLEAAGVAP